MFTNNKQTNNFATKWYVPSALPCVLLIINLFFFLNKDKYWENATQSMKLLHSNGTMLADIFKRKMAHTNSVKMAVFCLKNCVQFFQESNSCK
jgi:hypothetical protein